MKSFKKWLRARLAFVVSCLGLGMEIRQFSIGDSPLPPEKKKLIRTGDKLRKGKNHDNRGKLQRTGTRGK